MEKSWGISLALLVYCTALLLLISSSAVSAIRDEGIKKIWAISNPEVRFYGIRDKEISNPEVRSKEWFSSALKLEEQKPTETSATQTIHAEASPSNLGSLPNETRARSFLARLRCVLEVSNRFWLGTGRAIISRARSLFTKVSLTICGQVAVPEKKMTLEPIQEEIPLLVMEIVEPREPWTEMREFVRISHSTYRALRPELFTMSAYSAEFRAKVLSVIKEVVEDYYSFPSFVDENYFYPPKTEMNQRTRCVDAMDEQVHILVKSLKRRLQLRLCEYTVENESIVDEVEGFCKLLDEKPGRATGVACAMNDVNLALVPWEKTSSTTPCRSETFGSLMRVVHVIKNAIWEQHLSNNGRKQYPNINGESPTPILPKVSAYTVVGWFVRIPSYFRILRVVRLEYSNLHGTIPAGGWGQTRLFNSPDDEPRGGAFTWHIENFSKISKMRHLEYFYSPEFSVGRHQWRIVLYPTGEESQEGDLSIYLFASDLASLPHDWSIYAGLNFMVINQLDGNLTKSRETRHYFNANQNPNAYLEGSLIGGFKSFMPLDVLSDFQGFLVDDTLIIKVTLVVCRVLPCII